MAYSLELQFDAAADAAVRRMWAVLEEAGIPTPAGEPGRPHLSLARCDLADPASFASAVSRFARDEAPFDVAFGAIGVFPPDGWVFLAPVTTSHLLDVHARVHAWLAALAAGAGGVNAVYADAYAPGLWVPHCTLTTRLAPELAARALQLCLRLELPRCARIERLGLTRYPPLAELHSAAIGMR